MAERPLQGGSGAGGLHLSDGGGGLLCPAVDGRNDGLPELIHREIYAGAFRPESAGRSGGAVGQAFPAPTQGKNIYGLNGAGIHLLCDLYGTQYFPIPLYGLRSPHRADNGLWRSGADHYDGGRLYSVQNALRPALPLGPGSKFQAGHRGAEHGLCALPGDFSGGLCRLHGDDLH